MSEQEHIQANGGQDGALLSVHDLQTPRTFSAADRERCRAAAATIAGMLDDPA